MAGQCCVCSKKFGFFDPGHEIVTFQFDYTLCDECHSKLKQLDTTTSPEEYDELKHNFDSLLNNPTIPKCILDYFNCVQSDFENRIKVQEKRRFEREQQQKELEEAHKVEEEHKEKVHRAKQCCSQVMLTTGPNFEGYRITKYLDIVYEDIVFKNSLANRISATFEDLVNSLSFEETEMTGTNSLIARARTVVLEKFKYAVALAGGNAAIAVDFENSIGTDIIRVAVFGTAVFIEKIE